MSWAGVQSDLAHAHPLCAPFSLVPAPAPQELGNYAEYSGGPTTAETYAYARTLLEAATSYAGGGGPWGLQLAGVVWVGGGGGGGWGGWGGGGRPCGRRG